jgi:hypothetical protein
VDGAPREARTSGAMGAPEGHEVEVTVTTNLQAHSRAAAASKVKRFGIKHTKLSDKDVRRLRKLWASGVACRVLAKKFGISAPYAFRLAAGQRCKRLPVLHRGDGGQS